MTLTKSSAEPIDLMGPGKHRDTIVDHIEGNAGGKRETNDSSGEPRFAHMVCLLP